MVTGPPRPEPSLPPVLRRARQGRLLGGVCRGIAERWAIPVLQVRALFVLASVLAGFGALVYAAFWLVLPTDDGADGAPSLVRGLASLALLVAAAAGLGTLAAAGAAAALFGFGWAVAVVLGVFLVGALVAWPAARPAWVIPPLVALALPAVAVAATGVRIKPETRVVIVAPRTAEELSGARYEAGLGDMLVDLRGLRAASGTAIPVTLRAGTGDTVVALPRDRCFNLDVRYRTGTAGIEPDPIAPSHYDWDVDSPYREVGPVEFYGRAQRWTDGRYLRASSDPAAPTLRIDFRAVRGALVIRDFPASTGPLYDPSWPSNLRAPASPGELRLKWGADRIGKTPGVRKRWRTWRKQRRAFVLERRVLRAGACAPASERATDG